MKPIKYEKTISYYKCPNCEYENSNENITEQHIYSKHYYPALEKSVKLMGNQCVFESQDQAKEFVSKYAAHRSDFDNSYSSDLKWDGPGKYVFHDQMTRDFHHQSDLGREYLLTFSKVSF